MKWSKFNILFYSQKIGYALFNSRMLSFSKLDKESFDILSKLESGNMDIMSVLSTQDIDNLRKKKILVDDKEDDNYVNVLKYRKQLQSYTSKILGIIVCPTLYCNFACPYCYERNLPKVAMKETVQDELIEFINRNSDCKTGMTLNWHGGEPLTAFGTIKSIYSKIDKFSKLDIIHSSMVSNGYLLNEEICKYLNDVHLEYLQITIDGTREIHDKTRKPKDGSSSFNRIIENIDMALELMPHCRIGIRTNIGHNNQKDYVDLYNSLSKRWKGKNCDLYHSFIQINGINSTLNERKSLELSTRERNDFEIYLAENGIISKESLYPHLDHAHYTCMDCNAYVIDPEGYIYKCWSDVGLVSRRIGDLKNGIKNFDIVAQFMTGSDKFSDKKCLDCSFIPICEGSCNLYRVCFLEKGIPYEVCDIDKDCLVKLLEIYYESKDEK